VKRLGGRYTVIILIALMNASVLSAQEKPPVLPLTSQIAAASDGAVERKKSPDTGASGRFFPLEETLKALGQSEEIEFRWEPLTQTGTFVLAGHRVVFQSGVKGETGLVMLDGREILEIEQPYREKGGFYFPEAFITPVRSLFLRAVEEDKSRFRIAAIIIDPGHGGKDSGAVGKVVIDGKQTAVVEKEITLQVSRALYTRLSAAYPDKRVLLTRQGDTYPSLEARVALANSVPLRENEAIIFISLHANASFNTKARGYEFWFLSPEYRRDVINKADYPASAEVMSIYNDMLEEEFTTESIIMARSLLKSFDESLGSLIPSRGIKAEEWFVVRNARMPSVLVELGFVTNPDDAKLLISDEYLNIFSEALYKGIDDFVVQFERSGGFTAIQ
jgi:N-acetylmuramoyl-L-alanine amidase